MTDLEIIFIVLFVVLGFAIYFLFPRKTYTDGFCDGVKATLNAEKMEIDGELTRVIDFSKYCKEFLKIDLKEE
jgi:hypothetical protein